MKTMKPAVLFVFGILAVLLAVGCSNPIAAPEDAPAAGVGTGPDIDPDSPFTVTFTIGQNGNVRSVAGPDLIRIKQDGGLRNYVQLIVVDQVTQKVVEFAEQRKSSPTSQYFELAVDDLYRDKTYSFLLLMGYWKHDGNYNYDNSTPPTLLAAGLAKDKQLNSTGDTTVSITMYTLVVDTKFESTSGAATTLEPGVFEGKPGNTTLSLGQFWKASWKVQRGGADTNGFEMALIPAQRVINPNPGNDLVVKTRQAIYSGTSGLSLTPTGTAGNSFSYTIPTGEIKSGNSGYVNFNLEYVPFSLSAASAWAGQSSSYFPSTTWPPVWIIRNGLNDNAQNKKTDFNNFGKSSFPDANGNGAVRFVVELGSSLPPLNSSLKVQNGSFDGGLNTTTPTIKFDTTGYTGTADVWYAVVGVGQATPAVSNYRWVDSVTTGHNTATITVSPELVATGYDVYVFIAKGGEKSDTVIIRARLSGGILINWGWGDEGVVTHTDLMGGITPPVVGMAPNQTFTSPTGQYSGGTVTWYNSANQVVTGPFTGGSYTAKVTLTTNSGNLFGENISFTYSGASVSTSNNTGNSITVSITFLSAISRLIDLSGIICEPVEGEEPLSGVNYSGPYYAVETLAWLKDDVPMSETELFSDLSSHWYTAIVMLDSTPDEYFSALTEINFRCFGASIAITDQIYGKITLAITFPKPAP